MLCADVTNLLKLFDSTLVDTTALVDQVCTVVSDDASRIRSQVEERLRPVVVDLPESTWPMTTTLI